MEAIVRTDGRQIRVAEGEAFDVGRIAGEPGDVVELNEVVALIDGADLTLGSPLIDGAQVQARILGHGRGPKLTFMKYKNKVRYRRKIGHRQTLTRLVVEGITKG